MKVLRIFLPIWGWLLLTAGIAAAQPSISAVVNNASGILQGLPNAGIAQGSIFLVVGSGLGPAALVTASTPFQNTTLSGVSVSLTVNSTTVSPLIYYASATQISALLPSNTPVGPGTITATYNGQTSATAPITVVQNNVGIFTWGSNGQGVGIVTYPDYSLVSDVPALHCGGPYTSCGAANPGDTLTLWATGLGPVSGNEAAGAGLGVNMPNIALTLWLGGVQAPVSYQGRSGCCIGEDQIVFTVPSNAPTGCAVPLAVQIGNNISNFTLIAVAKGSRTCVPSNPAITSSAFQSITTGTMPFNYAQIQLRRELNISRSGSSGLVYQDDALGAFAQFTFDAQIQSEAVSYLDNPPFGTCMVYNMLNSSIQAPHSSVTGIDAGKITVTGANGLPTILTEKQNAGQVTQYSVVFSSTGTYFSGGNYTMGGAGGKDVGAFSANFTISAVPVWSSSDQFTINKGITRANGLTLNWTGGSSNYYIEIQGSGATDNTFSNGAIFSCLVPSTAGTFTIPASVLLALPAGPYSQLNFKPTLYPVPFSASNLDLGFVLLSYESSLFPPLT